MKTHQERNEPFPAAAPPEAFQRAQSTAPRLTRSSKRQNTPAGGVSPGRFRLVATDLDGTLLRPGDLVSERTRQALQQAQAAGAVVVLVSGRPPGNLRHIAQAAGVNGLAVCSNGALIYQWA